MRIELQFRTHLQHLWATAVETLGLFTSQAIKAGQCSDEIKRFFVVTSSLFAISEGCPVVPGTSDNLYELRKELKAIDSTEHILENLKAITLVLFCELDKIPDKQGYFILRLNYSEHMLRVQYFLPSEYEKANMRYDEYEESRDENTDVVLIRASSFTTVRQAYPNYFMDIKEFINLLMEYIQDDDNIGK